MDNKTALAEATYAVVTDLLNSGIPGLRTSEKDIRRAAESISPDFLMGSIYASWEQGWGLSATLYVKFEGEKGQEGFKVTCELSWPSTTYDLQNAKMAATLHAAVINLAQIIEMRTAKYAPKKGR